MYTVSYKESGQFKRITFPTHKGAIRYASQASLLEDHTNVVVRRDHTPCDDCRSAYACAYAFDPRTKSGTCLMVSQ